MICCPPIRPPVPSAGGPHRPPRFAQSDICLASKHLVNGSCLQNAISAPDSAIGARLGACTGSSACVCVGSPRRRGWLSRHVVHAARHSSVSCMDRAARVPLKGLVGPPRDAATMPRLESVGSRAVSGRWLCEWESQCWAATHELDEQRTSAGRTSGRWDSKDG